MKWDYGVFVVQDVAQVHSTYRYIDIIGDMFRDKGSCLMSDVVSDVKRGSVLISENQSQSIIIIIFQWIRIEEFR